MAVSICALSLGGFMLYSGATSVVLGLVGDNYAALVGSTGPLGAMNRAMGELYEEWRQYNILVGTIECGVALSLCIAAYAAFRARPGARTLVYTTGAALLLFNFVTLPAGRELMTEMMTITEEHTSRAIAELPNDTGSKIAAAGLRASRGTVANAIVFYYGFIAASVAYVAFAAWAFTRPGVRSPAGAADGQFDANVGN